MLCGNIPFTGKPVPVVRGQGVVCTIRWITNLVDAIACAATLLLAPCKAVAIFVGIWTTNSIAVAIDAIAADVECAWEGGSSRTSSS